MIINLNELNIKNDIAIDYEVLKDDKLDSRIINLKDSKVTGKIYENAAGEIKLECLFNGTMIIEDAINLDDIPYDFKINIDLSLDEIKENCLDSYDFHKNTLDLKEILWQNIVLEVPISYSKVSDAKLKGDGWELIDEVSKNEEIDPRLEKLKDLLER